MSTAHNAPLVICAAWSAHRCYATGAPTVMVATLPLMYVIAATIIVGLLTTMARREARVSES